MVLDYLKEIFFFIRILELNYNICNREDYIILKCRLEIFKKLFVFDMINKWNSLSLFIRNNFFFIGFKSSI